LTSMLVYGTLGTMSTTISGFPQEPMSQNTLDVPKVQIDNSLRQSPSATTMIGMEEKTAERVRLIIDTTEQIQRALDLRVHKVGAERVRKGGKSPSKSDIANEILAAGLAEELAEIDGQANDKKPATKKKP
jgi:hypothetical protein